LLSDFRVLEIGPRLASAVTGRLYAELGADVTRIEPRGGSPIRNSGPLASENPNGSGGLFLSQNVGKRRVELDLAAGAARREFESLARESDLIVSSWHPGDLGKLSLDDGSLRALNPSAVIVYITPFGLVGPSSNFTGSDLVVFHSSGIAKSLVGPVDNPETTPPVRAHGQQAEFIAGIAAACAGMFCLFRREANGLGAVIDVSMQESLAFMDVPNLVSQSFGNPAASRKRYGIPGPNLAILPANDGYIAISPREERQWKNFMNLLGDPEWASDPRFADRVQREQNSEDVIAQLSDWTSRWSKMELFHMLQENRVPCFPLLSPPDHLESEQLKARNFFNTVPFGGRSGLRLPGMPYAVSDLPVVEHSQDKENVDKASTGMTGKSEKPGVHASDAREPDSARRLPLQGLQVVDLSWVIAGPTCTRYLASMGATVVKVETSTRPDPGRVGPLHDVLGQGKLGITLDLKSEGGLAVIKKLISQSDILVENFAPGVMDRLGLDGDTIAEINPRMVVISASGTGQSGPTWQYAAYGTLLQIYTGFAGLNGYSGQPPSTGMAWLDPLCGMLLAFVGVAALGSSRKTEKGKHIDFSMAEAVLTTMPGPLLEYQVSGKVSGPAGNQDEEFSPHGVFKSLGEDSWIAIAITSQPEWESLATLIGGSDRQKKMNLGDRREHSTEIDGVIEAWTRGVEPERAMQELQATGVPASASRTSAQLIDDPHLNERGFFKKLKDRNGVTRTMPTLPWRLLADHEPQFGQPPSLGGDTKYVLKSLLRYSDHEIEELEDSGALS
jgi:crotonobetainyl-CoA:carnitine CoA-transferase CaiB-like acyl-CoA transferase